MKQDKSTIEIKANQVINSRYHLYMIVTDSSGNQRVFSGGPGDRKSAGFKMAYEDLKAFYQDYTDAHPDFESEKDRETAPHPTTLIFEGSDTEVQAKVEKMLSLLERINAGNHDYKIPIPNWIRKVFGSDVAHCHNSNTVIGLSAT